MERDGSDCEETMPNQMARVSIARLLAWLPALAWMGVIFGLSSLGEVPGDSEGTGGFAKDALGHLAEYGVLTLLLWWAFRRTWRPLEHWALLLAFAVSFLYGGSDEFHQTMVPGRDGNLLDLSLDMLGAGMAMAALWLWRLRRVQKEAGAAPR